MAQACAAATARKPTSSSAARTARALNSRQTSNPVPFAAGAGSARRKPPISMTFSDVLHLLADDPAAPLDTAEVALLFATDEYPDLDCELYLRQIGHLALEVSPSLHGDLENRV